MGEMNNVWQHPEEKGREEGSDAVKYLEETAHREAELKREELASRKEQAELEQ